MSKGKLIVLDGADGAGKATQTRLLVERMIKAGHTVRTMDFPQYENNVMGKLLRECLDGTRGDFLSLDPRVASTLYAVDRFESKGTIEAWLAAGDIVILDRYVSSNMLHQGAKLTDLDELHQFLQWLDTLEHGVLGLPRPDMILYLDVPFNLRQAMLFKDGARAAIDTAESNIAHQMEAESNAQRVVAAHNVWRSVMCTADGALRTPEEIAALVYDTVQEVLTEPAT